MDKAGVMGSATIVGNLKLHGVTREVSVPISAMYASDNSFSATAISRSTTPIMDEAAVAARTLKAARSPTSTSVLSRRPLTLAAAPAQQ